MSTIDRIILVTIAIGVWIILAIEIGWIIVMQQMGELM